MADDSARKSPPDPNEPVASLRLANGESASLTWNEYRLALIGLVDFAGDWQALETAATLVVDGAAKAVLVRERLLPLATHLGVLLNRGLDGLEMLTARHWFRNGPVA
jgi:hypothetical protein